MAPGTSARLRSACRLQWRTLHPIPQDGRKTLSRNLSANTSGEGINEEENPVSLSENKAALLLEDAPPSEQTKDLLFNGSIKVGAPYMRFVVGRGGMTKRSIEKTTRATIAVPPAREVRSMVNLVVKSASQESVEKAIGKIKDALERAAKLPNLQYSHFISLPLASNKGLQEQLRSFKNFVLNGEQEASKYVSWFPETIEKGRLDASEASLVDKLPKIKAKRVVDPDLEGFFSDDDESDDESDQHGSPLAKITSSLFIRPELVHITVLMLKLYTDDSVNVAAAVLEGVKPKVLEILKGREPKLFLRGIDCLRGRPSEARVLSMKVMQADNDNHLQQACHAIRDAYTEAGLVAAAETNQELTLHATLMSTSLGQRFGHKPFDARKILAKYRLQDWGEYSINEIHLSQRFFYDKDGYYRRCGSFELPQSASS